MLSVPHWQLQCESQIESSCFASVHLCFIIIKQLLLYVREIVTAYSSLFHIYLGKMCLSAQNGLYAALRNTMFTAHF